jgi:hypothetical protein
MINDDINNAITNHLSILFTDESENKINMLFGQEIMDEIYRITAFAGNDIIWAGDDDFYAHAETVSRLRIEYSYLTESSLIKIADAAAYFWKPNQ